MNQVYFSFKNQLVTTFFCSLIVITSIASQPDQTYKPIFVAPELKAIEKSCKLIIVIPAYNEANRITKTLSAYSNFFKNCNNISATFLVVCNNCADDTAGICKRFQTQHTDILYMDLKPGGKGFAVKQGFLRALEYTDADFIGFVDADMATEPIYFYELITKIQDHDGAIASRYKKGARVWPNRPFIKKIGGKFYNWILRKNFHFDIRDTQCGAKLFTYKTIQLIAPEIKETGWAFDLELLYLCQLFDKNVIEVPTTWVDAPGSHLQISGCYKEFISAPTRIKNHHKELAAQLAQEKHKKDEAHRKEKRLEKKHTHRKPQFMASK